MSFSFGARAVPLAIALLSASVSVHAQSSLNIYGVIDLSVGSFQSSNSTGAPKVTQVNSNLMTTSFLGFKGLEDLGGGLKAGFVLDTFFRPDTGAQGRPPVTGGQTETFWSRNANVYLQGGFGKITIGRQAPMPFLQAANYNPLGSAFGLAPIIRLTYGGPWGNELGDSAWSNAIGYNLPAMGGFNAGVQVQTGENSPAEGTSYAVAASYTAGPFSVAASTNSLRSAEAPKANLLAGEKQKFSLFNVSYDFGVAKLFGQIGQIKNKGFPGGKRIDTDLYQLGASVPVTAAGKVLVSYGQSTEEAVEGGTTPKTKHSIFTLAYDHYLSKRTDVYVAFMLDDEKLPGFKKGNNYAVGIRHAF